MLPPKVSNFINSLSEKTEAGQLLWTYNDEESTVHIEQPEFHMTIRYSFNTIEEVGQFVIFYFDKSEAREYRFSTSEIYNDYARVMRLFDAAQASRLKLPF